MATELPVIGFVADCLKFTAVPAGLLEILSQETRAWIDHAIESGAKIARQISRVAILSVAVAVPVALGLGWSVHFTAIILYSAITFGIVIIGWIVLATSPDKFIWVAVAFIIIGITTGIFSFLGYFVLWGFEEGATLSMYSPYVWVEQHILNLLQLSGSLYTPDESLAHLKQRQAELNARLYGKNGSFWSLSWLLDFSQFFRFDYYWVSVLLLIVRIAAGLFVTVFVVLNLGVLILMVSLPVWGASEGIHLLYVFSNWMKTRFALEPQTRIPVLAAVLWAVGETISFVLSIRQMFW